MEELITIPLEEEIAKIDQIDELTSTSGDGISTIIIELDTSVKDVFKKQTEVQNQIERVRDFPVEADDPVVSEMKFHQETFTIGLVGSAPEREIKQFAEDFESAIKRVDGVEQVDISGLREREIWVAPCLTISVARFSASTRPAGSPSRSIAPTTSCFAVTNRIWKR